MPTMWIEKEGLFTESRLNQLRVRHGFTTRSLGNMKEAKLREGAASSLGLNIPLTLKQVHQKDIHLASHKSTPGLEGDGWIVNQPGIAVAVYAADCLPLYIWSDDAKAAGIFHAGWKGTKARIAQEAVEGFSKIGVKADRLYASMGPHIRSCCYQVGREFEKYFPLSSFIKRGDHLYFDLALENKRQLIDAGVLESHINSESPCTASNPEQFFSYRRQDN